MLLSILLTKQQVMMVDALFHQLLFSSHSTLRFSTFLDTSFTFYSVFTFLFLYFFNILTTPHHPFKFVSVCQQKEDPTGQSQGKQREDKYFVNIEIMRHLKVSSISCPPTCTYRKFSQLKSFLCYHRSEHTPTHTHSIVCLNSKQSKGI